MCFVCILDVSKNKIISEFLAFYFVKWTVHLGGVEKSWIFFMVPLTTIKTTNSFPDAMWALWFCFVKHIYFFTVFIAIFVAHLFYSMSVFYVLTHFLEFFFSHFYYSLNLDSTQLSFIQLKFSTRLEVNILDCKLVYDCSADFGLWDVYLVSFLRFQQHKND